MMRASFVLSLLLLLSACSSLGPNHDPAKPTGRPSLTPETATHADLRALPPPKGAIVAAVYGFRDLTGQYKPSPDSLYSTAVTQGAAAMLVKAMLDSHWFSPVEREGLQDLLTERRIVRAEHPAPAPALKAAVAGKAVQSDDGEAPLLPATILFEGGIIGYESNVRTGGAGAAYLGTGLTDQYQTDQVTVNLRAVDTRTGRILESVTMTKTIYSQALDANIFRYVTYKRLLQLETGYTRNEPVQLCVQEALQAALIHVIVEGARDHLWGFKDERALQQPLVQTYLKGEDGR